MTARRPLSPSSSLLDGDSKEYEPKAKRQALPNSEKACIVCNCTLAGKADWYRMYIVDLNSGEGADMNSEKFIPRVPALRLDGSFSNWLAFCALNSKLYVFGGTRDHYLEKSMLTYALSDVSPTSDLKLRKDMMTKGPDMQSGKCWPCAVPFRDADGKQKILVFSDLLLYKDDVFRGLGPNFEIYDLSTDSWEQLPEPPLDISRKQRSVVVFFVLQSYCVSNSLLTITIGEVGMFTLDLNDKFKSWKQHLSLSSSAVEKNTDGKYVVIDDICFTPQLKVYDVNKHDAVSNPFYLPSSLSKFGTLFVNKCDMYIVQCKGDECNLCVMQTGYFFNNRKIPYLLLEVVRCSLLKYRADKEEMGDSAELSTTLIKSFKFILDEAEELSPAAFFTM